MSKPLYHLESEEALVAVGMVDTDTLVLDVTAADFHDEELGAIWGLAQDIYAAGEHVDLVILDEAIRARGLNVNPARLIKLHAIDGLDYTHGGTYAKTVKGYAQRRRIEHLAQQLVKAAYNANGSLPDEIAKLTGELARLNAKPSVGKPQIRTEWTAQELAAVSFPEPVWAVPDLVPVGLTFLAGRPKVGKSWLALQIAIAKGTGGKVLDRQVTQGKVLYIALEDNGRRLQDRTHKQGMPSTADIRFKITWRRLTEGGIDDLRDAIETEEYALVILDTLGRAVGRAKTDDYGDMTELLGTLQELAISHDMAILVIDHHRKGAPGVQSDPIDDIMGSTGKTGAADAVLGLTKRQGRKDVTLAVTGRDVQQAELVLSWDAVTCCWQYNGTVEDVELEGRRGKVWDVLIDAHPEALTAGDIAKMLKMHRQNVIPLLNDLIREGKATKEPKQGKEQPYKAVIGSQDDHSHRSHHSHADGEPDDVNDEHDVNDPFGDLDWDDVNE